MDITKIEQIIKVFEGTSINKMSLEIENIKMSVEKKNPQTIVEQVIPSNEVVNKEVKPQPDMHVRSMYVGVFHDLGVKVGDTIKKGQIIGHVTVLNAKNDIISRLNGVVEKIYVNDGDIVQYNSKIIKLA